MSPTHVVLRCRWCLLLLACFLLTSVSGCKRIKKEYIGKRVLRVIVRADVGGMDPIFLDSQYDSATSAQVIEPLLEYDYLKRPLSLRPLLLRKMPDVSNKGLTYTFQLKKGIYFHDDPCFPKGKGRELVAKDVLYSFKRMANRAVRPRGWWVFSKRIVGFDKYRSEQYERVSKKKLPFDIDAPVEGFKLLDRYRFQIKLVKPFPQLLFLLAFQKTGIVPREAVEYYGKQGRGSFSQHPVGTGPYTLKEWRKGLRLVFRRNPKYKHSFYPTAKSANAKDKQEGRHLDAGKPLPMSDILEVNIFQMDQPAWLKFRVGDLDYVQVAAEYWPGVFYASGPKKGQLRDHIKKEGLRAYPVPLLDFIYHGFNFKDPIVGGYGKRARYLRLAMAHALDLYERNRRFYNSKNVVYQGVIPPGLSGYGGPRPKPDLKKAREYLVKAGYPEGKGLPPLTVSTSSSSNAKEQSELFIRQMARIGVRVRFEFMTFPQLSRKLRSAQTQIFSLAWGSDYPDAENNLALFWGPNSAPGSNSWNYNNPVYNKLYEKARVMMPSPQRAKLYRRMNQILIDDAVVLGSMARTRSYLANKRLKNLKPNETMSTFWKYLRVPKFRSKRR